MFKQLPTLFGIEYNKGVDIQIANAYLIHLIFTKTSLPVLPNLSSYWLQLDRLMHL